MLPNCCEEYLAKLSPSELVDLLIGDEDRVPRNAIDECARRGDAMAERLAAPLADDWTWQDETQPGKWWLLLHAIVNSCPGRTVDRFHRYYRLHHVLSTRHAPVLRATKKACRENVPRKDLSGRRPRPTMRAMEPGS